VKQTGQGRDKNGKDLEVGAVDELLVGECEDGDKDKEKELYRCPFTWPYVLPSYIITNNIYLKIIIYKS